jgi:hypothetical protein
MSVYSLTRKRYTDLDNAVKILENRKRETFKLDGIKKIFFDNNGKLNFRFLVRESDEFQYGIYSNDMLKEWYLPKHAFAQLATYLDIPIRLYDFIQLGRKLEHNENDVFLENLTENLELLCQERLEREKNSKRLKNHYITVFDDIFGTFIRRISSEIYRPYEDYKALIDTNNNLEKVNNQKGTNYHHRETYISPYKLTSNFIDESQKINLKKISDEVKGGITLINSETKDSSYGFQALIFRLACENGLISEYKDAGLTVKHMGDDFKLNTKKAFIKVLELGKDFAKMFVELDKSEPISNDWNDIYELPDTLFQMRNNEKKELIEIAQKESYPFSAYGVVQALTFKSNHDAISDSKFSNLNQKAVDIARKVDKFNQWKPKRLEKKETPKLILDGNELEFL